MVLGEEERDSARPRASGIPCTLLNTTLLVLFLSYMDYTARTRCQARFLT